MGKEIEIHTEHITLAGLSWGPDDGFRVLALHGWLDNAASFAPLAPELPDARLVALDLPGHGRSNHRPPGMHYHFVDYVPDVLAAADRLGWKRFILLGHSLGAAVGTFIAASIPDRVSGLALIDAIGPLSRKASAEPGALARSMEQMAALTAKRAAEYDHLEQAVRVRMQAGDLSYTNAGLLTARSIRATSTGITWSSDPKLRVISPHYVAEEQILSYMGSIEAPTLLIRASDGHLHSRAGIERRCAQIQQLQIVDLPGGHHLHMETPRATADVLQPFFRQVLHHD